MKQAADAESYFHLHSNSHPQLHPRIILKEEYAVMMSWTSDLMDTVAWFKVHALLQANSQRAKKRIDKE